MLLLLQANRLVNDKMVREALYTAAVVGPPAIDSSLVLSFYDYRENITLSGADADAAWAEISKYRPVVPAEIAGKYTAVAADDTAGNTVIATGLNTITAALVQITRAGVNVMADAVVTYADGNLTVADGAATYALTAGDKINWIVKGS